MNDGTYKLDELAREAGTSSRTVRYYVQRGLLPAPQFRGKDTVYGEEHLVRLRVIRRLQDAYLPLDAIAAELEGKSREELERLLRAPSKRPPEPPRAALEKTYSDRVLASARTWKRLAVAPGLELAVADDAPPETRAVVERLVEILEAMSNVKEGAK